MADTNTYDAIIIGGGHNGLTCAFYLAKAGKRVAVLEARDVVGGAAVTEEFHSGYRNSAASYTVSLLQPKVMSDMELARHGLQVVLRKEDNFLPTLSGEYMRAGWGGLTRAEIARLSPKDADAYDRYEAMLRPVIAQLKDIILEVPPNAGGGWKEAIRLLKLGWWARRLSLAAQRDLLAFFSKSAGEILDHYFDHELVKALFGFDAVVGNYASVYQPGSAYVLLHHLFGEAAGVEGAWGHAIGGMGAITQAMAAACRDKGVDIYLEHPAEDIEIEEGRVRAVRAGGKTFTAKTVAASVHPKILYERLIAPEHLDADFKDRIAQYKSGSGTFRMNVALDRLPDFACYPNTNGTDHLTAGIIIAPSLGYMDRAYDDARRDGWSRQPIVEILIPSTLDDSLAPDGHHVASLYCQQFAPTLPDGRSWDEAREAAADHIIKTVDRYAPGFAASVIAKQIHSPLDLERKFGLIGGDIFHGHMSLDQIFSARPVLGAGGYKAPIKGLYMCGSGTHPGGGVTGAPGHNAAKVILGKA